MVGSIFDVGKIFSGPNYLARTFSAKLELGGHEIVLSGELRNMGQKVIRIVFPPGIYTDAPLKRLILKELRPYWRTLSQPWREAAILRRREKAAKKKAEEKQYREIIRSALIRALREMIEESEKRLGTKKTRSEARKIERLIESARERRRRYKLYRRKRGPSVDRETAEELARLPTSGKSANWGKHFTPGGDESISPRGKKSRFG